MSEQNRPLVVNLAGAILFFFILLFIFSKWGPGIPFSVNQVTTNRADFFTVTAEGKVQTKPDSAEVNIGFIGNGKTVIEAQTKTNAVMNKVTEAIKKLGINASDIKTTNYSVNPQYGSEPISMMEPKQMMEPAVQVDQPLPAMQAVAVSPSFRGNTTPQITGYQVDSTIQVQIKDLTKVNSIIDSATQNGANQIYGVNFTVAEKDKFVSEARKIAIDRAKKKAAEISNQAGIRLGRLMNIYENENTPYGGMMYSAKAVPDARTGTEVEPGSTEIIVNVTLNYETR